MFSWFRSKEKKVDENENQDQQAQKESENSSALIESSSVEAGSLKAQEEKLETIKTEQQVEAEAEVKEKTEQKSWFSRLKSSLKATSAKLFSPLSSLFGTQGLSEEGLKQFKKSLIEADLGSTLVQEILDIVKTVPCEKECLEKIKAKLLETCLDTPDNIQEKKALMMVGVNGAGKTTTCAKLAHRFQDRQPLLVAADTYRAAATDQLELWAKEHQIAFHKNEQTTCSAAVSYEGLVRCEQEGRDLAIIDTSGRLHTSKNLMQELRKVHKVLLKKVDQKSLLTLLTLDAHQGQNMLRQVEVFHEYVPLDGLIITKIDGTSKAGALFAIMKKFQIPVYFIGCGEGLEDLQLFNPEQFVEALFEK